jgi:hypothetical protein
LPRPDIDLPQHPRATAVRPNGVSGRPALLAGWVIPPRRLAGQLRLGAR